MHFFPSNKHTNIQWVKIVVVFKNIHSDRTIYEVCNGRNSRPLRLEIRKKCKYVVNIIQCIFTKFPLKNKCLNSENKKGKYNLIYVLFVRQTETKYIKLKTKIQNDIVIL